MENEQITELSSPSVEEIGLISDEPSLDVSHKSVAIHLVHDQEIHKCHFWLGLFEKGSLNPGDLLNEHKIEDIFDLAARDGIAESRPIMLSDSSKAPAKFVYLLPRPDQGSEEEWIANVNKTTKEWAPQRVGIYLSPEIIKEDSGSVLLEKILDELIKETSATDYFLLPGAHGINSILNAALTTKEDLRDERITVYVFH